MPAQILKKVEITSMRTTPAQIHDMSVSIDSHVKIEGIEPVFTIGEAAALLPWSYDNDSVRRYFKDLPGVLVKYQAQRYKRPYRQYMIPKSVFEREWKKMASVNDANSRRAA